MSNLPPYSQRNRWQKIIYEADSYGSYASWRISTVLGAAFAVLCLIGVAIMAFAFFASEQGCAQKGDEYGLNSDYRVWANTCFAETANGQTVNMENVRENSRGQTIYLEGGKSLLFPKDAP